MNTSSPEHYIQAYRGVHNFRASPLCLCVEGLFLKDKLPAPIAGQINNVVGGGSGEGGVGLSDIALSVGGLLK
jgi:hypothetical protein